MRGYCRLLRRRYGLLLAKTNLVTPRMRFIGKQRILHVMLR